MCGKQPRAVGRGHDFGGADPGDDPDGAAAALFNRVKDFVKGGDALKIFPCNPGYRPTPKMVFQLLDRCR